MKLHAVWASILLASLTIAAVPAMGVQVDTNGDGCTEETDAIEINDGTDNVAYVLLGSPIGNAWVYLENGEFFGLQTGAPHLSGDFLPGGPIYHHSPENPSNCAPDTLVL